MHMHQNGYVFHSSKLKELVTTRLNSVKMLKCTLESLCIDNILRRKQYFCQLATQSNSEALNLQHLPADLKNAVLAKEFERQRDEVYLLDGEEHEELCSFLRLLLNSKMENFELPRCLFGQEADASSGHLKLWADVVTIGVDLRKVSFITTGPAPCNDVINTSFIEGVIQLKGLQVLHAPFLRCDDRTLQLIADNLPQLTTLTIVLDPERASRRGLAALSGLQHLRSFIFSDLTSPNLKFVRICFELLPKLRNLGHFNISSCKWETRFKGMHNGISTIKHPTELHIEELVLSGGVDIPDECSLPHLRALHLTRFRGDLGRLIRFESLTELGLHHVEPLLTTELLTLVGPRLHKLTLGTTKPLNIYSPFLLCPNLETFELVNCKVLEQFPLRSGFTSENLSRLHTLKMVLPNWCKFPNCFLMLLVMYAQQLRNLSLVRVDSSNKLEAGFICHELLYPQTHLQSLESFCCYDSSPYKEPRTSRIQYFNQHIMAYCPIKRYGIEKMDDNDFHAATDLLNQQTLID